MLPQKLDAQTDKVQESVEIRESAQTDIGLCLACGARITRCGRPFSDAIECYKCHKINIFNDSQQPVRLE